MAGGHSDTQNGRVESVRLKQLSVFRYLRQPRSATTLKKWRGEESPSVLRRRGCQRLERAQFPRDQPHSSTPTEICEPGRTSPFDKSIRVTLTAANKLPR